ncbi:mitochondrial ribosomal protein L45 [Bombus vancouverensis nearcticus]|uniref:mitochondrial ribosomal protein L45 n=1 Tax=Bombus vancouverensis nearcticus TaxID=2705178 RepID=UPI0014395FBF|nr:probable 39S ribosomal protein L45, mitochondrial [Bombus vancouverensis nearcticus]
MIQRYRNAICIFGKYMQNNLPVMLGPINYPVPNDSSQQVRNIKKHFNPKYRKERGKKVIKIKLPTFDDDDDENNSKVRTKLKEAGILPQRNWSERPVFISSTPAIFDSYVAPEGDGKFSPINRTGAKQKFEFIEKKSKSFMALRKIKTYEDNYSSDTFRENLLNVYKKAHEALCRKDQDEILQYVTETAYPLMIHNVANKTIVWKFLESLEPARIVHARVTSLISRSNLFAQVTIRFHTQQLLCIYDRFGRLLLGSETVKKDVLDYIVFEKHISNVYGTWRIHGKIIPNWLTPNEISATTYILPKKKEEPSSSDSAVESVAQAVPPETLDEQHTDAKP